MSVYKPTVDRDEEGNIITEETKRGVQVPSRFDEEGRKVTPHTDTGARPSGRQLQPGSYWYERGFRTMDDVNKRGDAHYGIHPGSMVPANSIIITTAAGKKERLVGDEIRTRGIGAVETGNYTIPAPAYDGKTVYLTPEQVKKLAEAKGKELFNLQVKAGIIEPGSRFESWGPDERLRYIPQSEFKRQKAEREAWE